MKGKSGANRRSQFDIFSPDMTGHIINFKSYVMCHAFLFHFLKKQGKEKMTIL